MDRILRWVGEALVSMVHGALGGSEWSRAPLAILVLKGRVGSSPVSGLVCLASPTLPLYGQAWWLTPAISATQKVEAGEICCHPRQKCSCDPISINKKAGVIPPTWEE
jgi:hypothetical protein